MSSYRDFYIKQIEAKTLEKNKKPKEALKLYLEIIAQYSPNEDTSYKEAIKLLKFEGDMDKAIEICQLAINQIEIGKLDADPNYFRAQIGVLKNIKAKLTASQEENQEKKHMFDYSKLSNYALKIILFIISLFVAIALSWKPESGVFLFSKFFFIVAISLGILSLTELVKNLLAKVFKLYPVAMLFLCLFLSMVSALYIPAPEWAVFFDIRKFIPNSISAKSEPKDGIKVITNTSPTANLTPEEKEEYHRKQAEQSGQNASENQAQAVELNEEDLKKIQNSLKKELQVSKLKIKPSSNSIYINLVLDENLDKEQMKDTAQKCLDEFIKSQAPTPVLKRYSIYIHVLNEKEEVLLQGGVRKDSNKTEIKWAQ